MAETPVVNRIILALSNATSRVWRNNTGSLQNEYGRWVTFGLAPGSSDVIGITAVTVTPEMVGKTIGVFVSVEVKKEGPDTTDKERREAQINWLKMVRRLGGRAGIARTVNEAVAIIEGRT